MAKHQIIATCTFLDENGIAGFKRFIEQLKALPENERVNAYHNARNLGMIAGKLPHVADLIMFGLTVAECDIEIVKVEENNTSNT